jgi:hypothetical protein
MPENPYQPPKEVNDRKGTGRASAWRVVVICCLIALGVPASAIAFVVTCSGTMVIASVITPEPAVFGLVGGTIGAVAVAIALARLLRPRT